MNRQDWPANARSPIIVLTIVLALTWGVLAGLGWLSYRSFHDSRATTQRRLKIEVLRGSIIYLDEVLTMSARIAVEEVRCTRNGDAECVFEIRFP